MRLPFLQVSQEEMARARTLAGYLGVPYAHALGMTVALKAAALEAAPEGDVSGAIRDPSPAEWMAVQCGWPLDRADALAAALLRCGFAIAGPSGGHSVANMEPYARALDTSGKRSEAGRRGAQARKERGGYGRAMAGPQQTNGSGMAPDAKTQTQTQTQKEEQKIPPTPMGGLRELSHPVFDEVTPAGPSDTWTLPDAVDAVHREVMEGRPYRWDLVHDEKAATILLSLCASEGIPVSQVPEEAGKRFGRALVRSLWRFERAAGKAVTLRELARRECWAINAEAPRSDREVRNETSGVAERREVAVEPWDAMLAKREAA